MAAIAVFSAFAWWRARHVLQESVASVQTSSDYRYQFAAYEAHVPSGFDLVSTAADFRNAIVYDGDLFVCGKSALYRYSKDGALKATLRVGLELPPAPLVTMAVRQGIGTPELWIATNGEGALVYNGQALRQLRPEDEKQRKITALLALPDSRVLLGTSDAGLLVFDGQRLKLFHEQFAKANVTALAGGEDGIWVGTRTEGAWLWRGGQVQRFIDELPDRQVLALATADDKAWIGTAVGVAEFQDGRFSRRVADGLFAQSLALSKQSIWIGTPEEGAFSIDLALRQPRPNFSPISQEEHHPVISLVPLSSGDVLAVSPDRLQIAGSREWLIHRESSTLTDGNIAALNIDDAERLWIGYFDRGLDVMTPEAGSKVRHWENDQIFCVNRIVTNPATGITAVATANGLALFDRSAQLQQMLNRKSGLIASHVSDVLFREHSPGGSSSMVVATPAGISFVEGGSITSLYAFQGLVNNHTYTVADRGDELLVGTLGGFSLLQQGLVKTNFTTANSALKQNWITAALTIDGDTYLGTYGSGVVRLDARGDLHSFSEFRASAGRVEINLNAMAAMDHAIYAGTLGRGLAVFSRDTGRWRFVTQGLPSLNVTALTAKDGFLYVGTDNGLMKIEEQSL